ncbi:hypothetical protein STK_13180 [Sulfurisphaera tokodaii str. 7]|uniref:ParB-like N-terminal domain-containing protein n=1 Tax=Sulfurisphaera tokodaii (strain DSM 16993 / JCM 10545 / NBRC 100140 / 7) TaxID=273063 RepID=Q971P3_SULTO|nr:ParB N-terminal domain-containing protein [Sulfurisphaera tokodaii]BAB66377.1 hypothetical protein STK_13180 [Sulfurisphaera tokodaii str. 7]
MSHGNTLSYSEEVIPIEKLKEDEEFKSLVPPNNMKEQLASSIAKNGQTLPIDVDEDYVILDGYTRVSIMKNLNFKEVKVRKWNFKSSEDRATAYRLIAMLNLQRRHLDKNEVLKLLREIAEKILKISEEGQKFGANAPNFEQKGETNIRPSMLEMTMKQVKEEIGTKEVNDSEIKEYSLINTIPYLRQLVDDKKLSVRTAYELYKKAKDKLQKIASLPPTERNQLLTTREGRKIILERDDLLTQILEHRLAVSQAINKLKTEEKLAKSKRKSRVEKEDLEEEEEGETEGGQREDSESDEYPFVEDWKKANEELKKEEEEKQEQPIVSLLSPQRLEMYRKLSEEMFSYCPEIKQLYDEKKLSDDNIITLAEVWRNFQIAFKNLSLNWHSVAEEVLSPYLDKTQLEDLFYKFVKGTMKLYPREEFEVLK